MHIKPMKPFFSKMFRAKTLDVISLFHKPSIASSTRVANILKQASAAAQETATEDQATDHKPQTRREPFELEISENDPTPDQLRSIMQYGVSPSQLVDGATSESDVLRKIKEDGNAFRRPVVVDWSSGKAVAGDNESAILKLLQGGSK